MSKDVLRFRIKNIRERQWQATTPAEIAQFAEERETLERELRRRVA